MTLPETPPARAIVSLAAMVVATVTVMWSAYASTYMLHDSFWINLVWGDQFSRQVAEGTLYPRWLPLSHGGLGSPVFYFYPPLAFYLMAGFALIGMSTYSSMMAAFATVLLASGLTMYLWLKRVGNWPLAGALLYMIAPYHLFDFLKRGALAEFAAFAWLPLIALGIHRAAREGRFGLLAVSYAGLILTHLPAALIATIFLILPYVGKELIRDRSAVRSLAFGGLMGLGLAGAYLLPMAYFAENASLQTMTANPLQKTASWSIYDLANWRPVLKPFILTFALMYLAATAALALFARSFWAISAIIVLVLALGVLPGLWSIPILDRVQFPWRTFMIVEFMVITALAARPKISPGVWVVPASLIGISFLILRPVPGGSPDTMAWMLARHPDVAEYLPPGSPYKPEVFSSWALRLAQTRQEAAKEYNRVAFAFPTMRLKCSGRPAGRASESATALVSWDARQCVMRRVVSLPEVLGSAIALTSVIILVLLTILGRRRDPVDDRIAVATL